MVPSITHGLILAPLASSRRKEGASPLPRARASAPRGHLPGALPSCQPTLGIPALGIVLCASQAPEGKGVGGEEGEAAGEEGKGGRGGASISNFIINTLFCKVGACFCFCTQVSGHSFLCAEGRNSLSLCVPDSFLLLGGTHFDSQREECGDCSI